MKRRSLYLIIMTVAIIAVIFCFSGCGKETHIVMDPKATANNILESCDFDAEMVQVKKDAVSTFIELPEVYEGYMFMGDGSHSDCFGVFAFSNEDDSKDAEKAVESYLKELEDSFSRYIPEEADKVKNHSYVVRKENNVVFVVSTDEELAESVVSDGFTEADEPLKIEAAEETGEDVKEEETKEPEQEAEPEKQEESQEQTETEDETEKAEDVNAEFDLSNYPEIKTEKKLKYIGYIGVIGRSAYEIYDYVDGTAKKYAKLVNYTKKQLGEDVNVYDIVIPLSSGVTVPNKYFGEIQGSDQRKALDNIYSKMNDSIIPVNIYENLMKHRDEYIYFRTDHHWTSLGAYYAYEKWCDASGNLPIAIDGRDTINMGDFLGTFYNDTQAKALKNHPDELIAYLPKGDCYIKGKDYNGDPAELDVIRDYSDSADSTKYDAFLGGDKGLVTIVNRDIDDDSVCFVIKESFGNCLAPYFADHYHKVYVIDYRYFNKNIIEYAKKKGADDIIFANNIGMTRSSYLVGKLQEALKG